MTTRIKQDRGKAVICLHWLGVQIVPGEKDSYMAMSASSSSKLQFSKSVGGIFRRMLPAVPLSNNRCSKVVSCGHRVVDFPHNAALAERSITAIENKLSYAAASLLDTDNHLSSDNNILIRKNVGYY